MKLKLYIVFSLFFLASCASTNKQNIPSSSIENTSLKPNVCQTVRQCAQSIKASINKSYNIEIKKNTSSELKDYTKLKAKLMIELNYDGSIKSKTILESSGNSTFDKLVITATKKAAPFSVISGLKRSIFEKRFSTVVLFFVPPKNKQRNKKRRLKIKRIKNN